jgi:hypothetical protein
MLVKRDIFSRCFFKVGNGSTVRFWEDILLGGSPLSQQYPSLYNIFQRKDMRVDDVLAQRSLNIGSRRALNDKKWNDWVHLCSRLMIAQLSYSLDVFK